MSNRNLSITVLMLGVLLGTALKGESRSRKAPTRKAAAVSGSTGGGAKARASSGRKSARSGSKRTRNTTVAHGSGPARQQQPTPDRFMVIQQALTDKGYYTGPVDGVWSGDCVDALKRFQADQNLSPDGKLGSLSLIALGLGPRREPLPQQFLSKPEPSN
ncbi:MAG TPA: peptidoglycan-binding domain-containing protein [Bryobacteraceae bacterium]|nr:peptidoglycan-binding domain-containing protein [Bryobacteraceae bacterium]